MTQHKISSTKILGLGVALILVMISFLAWMPFAHADSNSTVVDKNATGSITVHSLTLSGDTGVAATGAEQNGLSNEKIQGSSFKLTKDKNIDVSTLAGMKQASQVTLDSFAKDDSFGEKKGTTNEQGTYKFENLKPGVYKLEQTKAAKGKQLAAPAIVVLPLTNPEGTGFMYDIHVYPKNAAIGSIKKENTTPAGTLLKEGAEMTFKITVPIPKHDSDKRKFTEFTVTDKPVSGLTMTADSVTEVKIGDSGSPLSKGDNADYKVEQSGKNVKVTFQSSGLTKLSTDTSSSNVIVNVKGTVNGIANASDTTVKNSAAYTYRLADGTNNGTEGEETSGDDDSKTTFGYVKIKNTDGNKDLSDGEFTVGKCAAGDKSVDTSAVVQANAKTTTEVGPIGPLASAKLCVQQTKAPSGYALNPEAKAVTFDSNATKTATKTQPLEVKIENTKANDFLKHLPLTGGSGVIGFLAGGIVLLIVAVALMARKRHQN